MKKATIVSVLLRMSFQLKLWLVAEISDFEKTIAFGGLGSLF